MKKNKGKVVEKICERERERKVLTEISGIYRKSGGSQCKSFLQDKDLVGEEEMVSGNRMHVGMEMVMTMK